MPTQKVYDLSPTEAAALIGVHVDTLKRWADEGRLPCWRTPGGRFRRFSREDVIALLPSAPTEAAS